MSNANLKVIYSLRVHIALQQMGFTPVAEMTNPGNPHFNCWVYEESEELLSCFDKLLRGLAHD